MVVAASHNAGWLTLVCSWQPPVLFLHAQLLVPLVKLDVRQQGSCVLTFSTANLA